MSGTQPVTGGQSNCGLLFYRGTTTPTLIYGEIQNSISNVWWQPIYSTSPVRTCEFKAIGDLTTDATPNIQAAIDYALMNGFDTVCLNDGNFRTTDTIQLGWGNASQNLVLAGCDNARNPYPGGNLGGPTITPDKVDRCAVNFQNSRMGGIKGIAFIGSSGVSNFINTAVAAPPFKPLISDWFPLAYQPGGGSNPLAGTVASGGTNQYAPYAAICIDAYTGASHTNNHYPSVTYPPWTGIGSTQYSKAPSSDITIQDIGITGFAAGIVISPNSDPAGTDNNGDFVKINRVTCIAITICGSVGQTQSRNVAFADVIMDAGWSLYTNDTFGTQSGNTTGYCLNVHAGRSYQLFSINMNIQPFFTCRAVYAEELVRIGNFHDGGSFSGSLTLEDCNLNFTDSIHRLSPAALIEYTQVGAVIFRSCTFGSMNRMQTLVHSNGNIVNVSIEGGTAQAGVNLGWIGNTDGVGIMQANNFGTVFLGDPYAIQSQVNLTPTPLVNWRVPSQFATMGTGISNGGTNYTIMGHYPVYKGSRRYPYHQALSGASDIRGFVTEFSSAPGGFVIDLVTGGQTSPAPSFSSCDIMTFGWHINNQLPSSQPNNVHIGDFWYHQPSGTIFVVTNISAPVGSYHTITTRQMNNMTTTNTPNIGTCATSNVDQTVAGRSYLIHTSSPTGSLNVPLVTFFGDFFAGSTAVNNIGPLNGETIAGNPITAATWAATGGGQVTFTTTNAHGLNPGDIFTTVGFAAQHGYNGTFSAISASGTTLVAALSVNPGAVSTLGSLPGILAVGDQLYGYSIGNNAISGDPGFLWPFDLGTVIATVTPGPPASLTLSQAALLTGRFPILSIPVRGVGTIKPVLGPTTVAALPACAASTYGLNADVTDALTFIPGLYLSAGGGANRVQATCMTFNQWVVKQSVTGFVSSGVAFSTIPGCISSFEIGATVVINDSMSAAIGAAVVGLGTNKVMAICNSGGTWVVQSAL